MNRLEKDLLFYSNYCLHSSNLLNSISKTSLNSRMFYICIDDSKIKVPSFITRVPSVFLVKDKQVLVEDEIDIWVNSCLAKERQRQQPQHQQHQQQQQQHQQQQQMPMQQQQQQMPMQQQQQQQQMHPQQQHQQQQMPPQQQQQQQMPPQQQQQQQMPPHQQQQTPQEKPQSEEDIMAYHSNEMGASMSGKYSFIESDGNSSLNHNFSFIDEASESSDTKINTPKEFNKDEGSSGRGKTDFDRLMEQRNGESFAQGVQRI